MIPRSPFFKKGDLVHILLYLIFINITKYRGNEILEVFNLKYIYQLLLLFNYTFQNFKSESWNYQQQAE